MADRTAAVKLTLRNEGFVAGLREASRQAKDFGTSVADGAKKNKAHLDGMARGFGAVGLAAGAVVALAVKRFADFDEAMSHVQAATHETAGNMAELRDAALDAGAKTKFSATEAAGAIENLAKAGVSTKDILGGGLKGALDLAAAGSLDVGAAAEIAATAMTQFGLSGKDVPHIADLLAAAAGKAQGEVSDMAMALKQGGLVAAQMGLSLEETTGTLAAFASAGLIGSDAGTSLKTMLLKLANPSVEAASAMKSLGLAAYDTQGNFVGLAPLAEQLKTKLGNLTPVQRDAALATIFGSDAIRAANVLYKNGAAGISDWTTKVNDTGYAAETAALKTDNLKGDLERLGGAFDTALIKAGSGANDALRALTQGVDAAVTGFAELPGWVQQGATALAGIAAVGGLSAAGLLKAATAAGELKAAWQGLGRVGKGLTLSMGAVGVALVAAVAIYGAFSKRNAEAKQKADDLRATLDEQTGAITGNTRAYVSNNLAQNGMAQKAKDLGLSLSTITSAALGNAPALEAVTRQLDAMIEAGKTNGPVTTQAAYDLTQQGIAAAALKEELLGSNKQLTEAQRVQKLAAEGASENKTAQELTAEATKKAAEAFQAEAQSLDDIISKMHLASGAALELAGSQISFQAALDNATEGIKENGKTLNINTKEGRANKTALLEIADSANKQTDAIYKSTAGYGGAVKASASARASFIQVAMQMGLTKKQAEAYATSLIDIPKKADTKVTNTAPAAKAKVDTYKGALNLLPKQKTTGVSVTGAAAARQQVLNLSGAINNLPSQKNIYIKMIQSGSVGGIPQGIKKPGSSAGGLIPGAPSAVDNHMRAMATGEFVVQASKVQGNLALLEAINSGRFQQTAMPAATSRAPSVNLGDTVLYATIPIDLGNGVKKVVRTEIKAVARESAQSYGIGG
jgi:TP901 family phage tail tape measure protein